MNAYLERLRRDLDDLYRAGDAPREWLTDGRSALDDLTARITQLERQVSQAREALAEIAELRNAAPGTDVLAYVQDLARATVRELEAVL